MIEQTKKQIFYDKICFDKFIFHFFFSEENKMILSPFDKNVFFKLKDYIISNKIHSKKELLSKYFSNIKIDFSEFKIDLDFFASTKFQKEVWTKCRELRNIGTITYSQFSNEFKLGSARSIGNALSKNPLPVFVPCHMVVSKQGLGGFMGSQNPENINLKNKLISFESTTYSKII